MSNFASGIVSIIDTDNWTLREGRIDDRPDAIAHLRLLVTLCKLGFCKHYENEDIYTRANVRDDWDDYDIGGMVFKVWT